MTDTEHETNAASTIAELASEDTIDVGGNKAGDSHNPRPRRKKSRIVLLAVAAVIVALVGGGGITYATQHDNPDFCNAVCHSPMDPYVASYKEGVSINPEQATSAPLLSVTVHKQAAQNTGSAIKCLTCHEADIGEQLNEGMHWVTGNYTDPLEPLFIVNGEPEEGQKAGTEFCLRPECHSGITTTEELVAATNTGLRNPHDTPHGKYSDCSTCHQIHEQSTNACAYCHPDAPLPDGWVKPRSTPK